ncbi:MAG: hypothetical protein ACYCV4_05525, partial [Dermatophilaceae bacterium]
LAPVLRALLAQYLLEVGPQIKAARKKEEEAMRTLGELLGGDDALVDPDSGQRLSLDDLVAGFFGPIPGVAEQQMAEEEAAA